MKNEGYSMTAVRNTNDSCQLLSQWGSFWFKRVSNFLSHADEGSDLLRVEFEANWNPGFINMELRGLKGLLGNRP